MKFKVFFSIFACLFLVALLAFDFAFAKPSAPAPVAVIRHPIYKFQPVIAGTVVTHTFKIENRGNALLKIPGVHSE